MTRSNFWSIQVNENFKIYDLYVPFYGLNRKGDLTLTLGFIQFMCEYPPKTVGLMHITKGICRGTPCGNPCSCSGI